VQILKLFHGVDLALLTKTWHFLDQHLLYIGGFDSFAVARIVQLRKTKAIKHSGGVVTYFRSHLSLNLSKWKEGSQYSYLWLWVNKGAAPNLFICMLYIAPIGSKHENESLFQNLATNIT
jgi:hypothetical protein